MKKLIFLILMIPSIAFSQGNLKRDFGQTSTIPAYTVGVIDTSWVFYTSANYTGSFGVVCTSLSGTLDCAFKMQCSYDGTTWEDLNMKPWTPTATDTVTVFHIPWSTGLDYDQIRLLFDRNSVSGGTIEIFARLNRRR